MRWHVAVCESNRYHINPVGGSRTVLAPIAWSWDSYRALRRLIRCFAPSIEPAISIISRRREGSRIWNEKTISGSSGKFFVRSVIQPPQRKCLDHVLHHMPSSHDHSKSTKRKASWLIWAFSFITKRKDLTAPSLNVYAPACTYCTVTLHCAALQQEGLDRSPIWVGKSACAPEQELVYETSMAQHILNKTVVDPYASTDSHRQLKIQVERPPDSAQPNAIIRM
ncbi:hypothetical protein O181_073737 [Austropuccinia psidii MF-1]|uniref:Uncharacterized protein n=1 Tax=Austropuccinia psidii MF-1 TaxID=1389203 RepID=A0A9Q3F9M5_9BASI|nr:hypothetical protein [Austropuccinia psidii MF-1]